jgi:hypothetical protein
LAAQTEIHPGVLLALAPPTGCTVPLLHQQQLGPLPLPAMIFFISALLSTFLMPFRFSFSVFIWFLINTYYRNHAPVFKRHVLSKCMLLYFAKCLYMLLV